MLDFLLSFIAPYACVSCSRVGPLLCTSCCSDVISDYRPLCIGCGTDVERGVCAACTPDWPIERAFVCAEREGAVKTLINDYKFSRRRSAYKPLAAIADAVLPYGMPITVVPLPTVTRHIRVRGYDHTALLARRLARAPGRLFLPALHRHGHSVQHGASKRDRIVQAAGAFTAPRPLEPDMLYLLIDDIVTTGASLKAAAGCLKAAGAERIWILAVARQPLGGESLTAGR